MSQRGWSTPVTIVTASTFAMLVAAFTYSSHAQRAPDAPPGEKLTDDEKQALVAFLRAL